MAKTSIAWTQKVWTRFVSRIVIGDPSKCWEWSAGCFSNGYGQFRVGKKKVRAHRAYYEAVIGPVPDGLILLHSCDNPRCCNPNHLSVGTHADNARDREEKGRGSHNGTSLPGESNPSAKLRTDDVVMIKSSIASGDRLDLIATRTGMSLSQIRNIASGKCWGNVQCP